MSYESWRISFQSSEQAARAAYAEAEALRAEVERLKSMTAVTMGVGRSDGSLFVHGDYDSIKAAQALVFRAERLAEALREAEKLLKRTPKATRDMYVGADPISWGVQAGNVLAMIRAALAQEGCE